MKPFSVLWNRWLRRDRRTRPTLRLVALVALWSLMYVSVANLGQVITTLMVSVAVVLALMAFVDLIDVTSWSIHSSSLEMDGPLQVGVAAEYRIRIQLRRLKRGRRTPSFILDDGAPNRDDEVEMRGQTTPPIRGFQHVQAQERNDEQYIHLSKRFYPKRRGSSTWNAMDVSWLGRFKLFQVCMRTGSRQHFKVLPDVSSWQKQVISLQNALLQEGRHVKRRIGGDSEYAYISEYGPDDDPRHVNWSATARRGRLMKNVYQPEQGQHIWIAVDIGRYMGVELPDGKTRLDYALSCAAALAQATIRAGDTVGLVYFSGHVARVIPPDNNKHGWGRLVESMGEVTAQNTQGGFRSLFTQLSERYRRRGLVILLTELDGVAGDVEFADLVSRYRHRYPLVVVSVTDVQATARLSSIPDVKQDLYEMAAAEWVISDREKTAQALRVRGIDVVESEPGDVVLDAVKAYFRHKLKQTI